MLKTTIQPKAPPCASPSTPGVVDLGAVKERTAPTNDPARPFAEAVPGLPKAEWADAMAEALAANPIYRIGSRDTAMPYFRGLALRLWDTTPDAYTRGLLLGSERHRHVRAAHLPSR